MSPPDQTKVILIVVFVVSILYLLSRVHCGAFGCSFG